MGFENKQEVDLTGYTPLAPLQGAGAARGSVVSLLADQGFEQARTAIDNKGPESKSDIGSLVKPTAPKTGPGGMT